MKKKIIVLYLFVILFLASCDKKDFTIATVPKEYQLSAWFTFQQKRMPIEDPKSKKWALMDPNGTLVTEAIYDEFLPIKQETLIAARKDGYWGMMDPNGKEIVPFQQKGIPAESEGRIRNYDSQNKKYYFTDLKNKKISEAFYTYAYAFSEHLAAVSDGEHWGFINLDGQLIIPMQYEDAKSFSNGTAAVKKNGKWGSITPANQWLIEPKYEEPFSFNKSGYAVVKKEEDLQEEIINSEGTIVVTPDKAWTYITMDQQEPVISFFLSDGFTIGFLNIETGEQFTASPVYPFSDGKCLVHDDTMQYYYIDVHGAYKTGEQYRYKSATNYCNGKAVVVNKENRCYLIDENEKEITHISDGIEGVSEMTDNLCIIYQKVDDQSLQHIISIKK